jgi:hypothetical protein
MIRELSHELVFSSWKVAYCTIMWLTGLMKGQPDALNARQSLRIQTWWQSLPWGVCNQSRNTLLDYFYKIYNGFCSVCMTQIMKISWIGCLWMRRMRQFSFLKSTYMGPMWSHTSNGIAIGELTVTVLVFWEQVVLTIDADDMSR